MKIRTKNKIQIAAVILSTTFLFSGCGTDDAEERQTESYTVEEGQTESDAAEEGQTESDAAEEGQTESDAAEEGQTESDAAEEGQTESNAVEKVSNSKDALYDNSDIYDSVLAEYSDMVQNDFYANLLDSDAYDSCFGENIGLEIRTHKQDIYYALYDIDGNGTVELIIAGAETGTGSSNPSFSPWNYDVYGYNGTKVVHLFPEMEFGYRTNFSLYENGVIEVFYSGSAAESGTDFYKIGDDGYTPELVDSFAAAGHLEGDEAVFVYSQKGAEIDEGEYYAGIQSYEIPLAAPLNWMQIQ